MARKRTEEFYAEVDQVVDTETFLKSVCESFCETENPRSEDKQTCLHIVLNHCKTIAV